jgi:ubiquinone/menaquinone biosynthesis C-methylase UbiE
MKAVGLEKLVQQLRAAGEPTRARILALLAHGELSVGELTQVLNQSQPALSRNLKLLTAAGLVERLPEGAWVFYRLPVEGPARELVDTLNASIGADHPSIRRDLEQLRAVKGERAEAAEQYFSRVAEEWDSLRSLHYSEADIEKAVLAAAGQGPFDLVVDFGTGTGRMLALFAGRARRVEGIDLSHQMLTVARSNLQAAGVANASVRHGDATSAPYLDHSANLIVVHQVLHFLDDPGRALAEAARILRPGGRLVVVDFAPHTLEHLRTEHAHRHLGVSEPDFQRWADKAGLTVRTTRTFRSPGGDKGVAVTVWTAESQKEAGKAGKRSAA